MRVVMFTHVGVFPLTSIGTGKIPASSVPLFISGLETGAAEAELTFFALLNCSENK